MLLLLAVILSMIGFDGMAFAMLYLPTDTCHCHDFHFILQGDIGVNFHVSYQNNCV